MAGFMFPPESLRWPRGCWPDATQELLLRACFLEDRREALTAWRAWRGRVPLDFVDGSSIRLLLFLHDRLRRLPEAVPELPRLAGLVRHQWAHTQYMRRKTVEVLRLFQAAGLDTMLIKGAALNATVYPTGFRPMADIDLVIRRSDIDAAENLLTRHGWKPRFNRPEVLRLVSHANHFTGTDGRDIDLHWDFFHERFLSETQLDALWEAARVIELDGIPTRVLCPEDQLIQICEHGMRHEVIPPMRWLADACRLVDVHGESIDWERCAAMAGTLGLLLPVTQTLRYLQLRLGRSIPPAAWSALERHPVPPLDRLAHGLVIRRLPGSHPFWQTLPRALLGYARLRGRNRGVSLGEYVRAINDLEQPGWWCLGHFLRMGVRVALSRATATLRSARARPDGQSIRLLPMAALPAERLEGMYPPELHGREVFRWSEPHATIRLGVPPGDYRVLLRLLPARSLASTPIRAMFNRSALALDILDDATIAFTLSPTLFADHHEQRLVLACAAWTEASGDPRALGLPLIGIELQSAGAKAPP